jgi:hypothetical protein
MARPRFFIITNDGPRAALIFHCHLGSLPSFLAVVDDPALFPAVPRGARCRAYWFGTRETILAWESVWAARTCEGGIEWIAEEDFSTILGWCERNRERLSKRLLYGIETAVADVNEPINLPVTETEQAQPVRRQSRWK